MPAERNKLAQADLNEAEKSVLAEDLKSFLIRFEVYHFPSEINGFLKPFRPLIECLGGTF